MELIFAEIQHFVLIFTPFRSPNGVHQMSLPGGLNFESWPNSVKFGVWKHFLCVDSENGTHFCQNATVCAHLHPFIEAPMGCKTQMSPPGGRQILKVDQIH